MDELRVNVDDLQVTAAHYETSAAELTGGAPAGPVQSCQASAAAVQAVHGGAATVRATAAARTATAGTDISAADCRYIENEAESAGRVRAVGSPVV